jgi:hypothetical protein
LIHPIDITGPVSILRISSKPDLRRHKKLLLSSIGITLRYSDVLPEQKHCVKIINKDNKTDRIMSALPYSIIEAERFRI